MGEFWPDSERLAKRLKSKSTLPSHVPANVPGPINHTLGPINHTSGPTNHVPSHPIPCVSVDQDEEMKDVFRPTPPEQPFTAFSTEKKHDENNDETCDEKDEFDTIDQDMQKEPQTEEEKAKRQLSEDLDGLSDVLNDPRQFQNNIKWLERFVRIFYAKELSEMMYNFFGEGNPKVRLDALTNNFAVLQQMEIILMDNDHPENQEILNDFAPQFKRAYWVFGRIRKDRESFHSLRMDIQAGPMHTGQTDRPDDQNIHIMVKFFFERASMQRLQRNEKGAVYEPVMIQGQFTHCYKYKTDMPTWLRQTITPEDAYPLEWNLWVGNAGFPSRIEEILTTLPDSRFPFLKKQEHLFSFDNGIFDIKKCTFYPYDQTKPHNTSEIEKDIPCFVTSNYIPGVFKRHPYLPTERERKEAKLDHAKFIKECEERNKKGGPVPPRSMTYEAIRLVKLFKTLNVFKFFEAQGYYDEDIFICAAMLGRALHNGGDGMEVAPYFRGAGGTGKSSLLKLIMEMLDPMDVGFIMGDGQVAFADEHLLDARLVLFMDIEKCNLIRTRFTSWVSHESIVVNRKHKTAISKQWRAALLLASNGQPPWEDQSGNLTRRFVIWLFDRMIQKTDTKLFSRCRAELVQLLVIISLMRNELLRIIDTKSIWDKREDGNLILPKRVFEAKNSYLRTCNALHAFLESASWIRTKLTDPATTSEDIVSESELNKQFQSYQKESGMRGKTMQFDLIEHAPYLQMHEATTTGDAPNREIHGMRFVPR